MKNFDSRVWQWFNEVIGKPTQVQTEAWPQIKRGKDVLISAPTGSGKTLASFFAIIDDLAQKSLKGKLEEKTYVVYVSPLKALSNDIEKNLQLPLSGIGKLLDPHSDYEPIKVGLRTGDTTPTQRTAMYRKPPHILVSTPESLYILLTSESGRKMLSSVERIIVDEIHAMVSDKRGSHLSLTMERLEHLTDKKLQRIGLSATQKPIEKVAKFLTGNTSNDCEIINAGLKRKLELSIDVPRSPLSPLMANEVWEEIYNRLEELIKQHQTTLIFVHTRRLAERMTHNLANRLGKERVASHHGSMSKEHRLEAESKLKNGVLSALVATASLELGIDIGGIDLVCQIGSPRTISSLMQRVGRSSHHVGGTPKGILFPLSRDELVECAAVIHAISKGELDELIIPEKPLDILAQQIVAELAGSEYEEQELFDLVRKAYPYKNLERSEFDGLVKMLSEGYTTRRGRRGAYVHHDQVNGRLRARKNARLTSLISGGAIPDTFDYDVIMEPTGVMVGTVNEDFAIESLPGDIFQLGNNSWRLLKLESGKVRVEDAKGAPPTIPFWFGEAPGRSKEMSDAVSFIRTAVSERLGNLEDIELEDSDGSIPKKEKWKEKAFIWLESELNLSEDAADQLVTYIASGKAALGNVPSNSTIILERFFDEAGDMHLVVHSPFGSRLNRAWGLSLRKRFCKKFNFELQAAATEDNIILSLGSTHSFPLEEVFQYLNSKTVREILIQALLDAPMFEVRWRWNASRALAIPRRQGGKKVPPQIQRSNAEDLIALVFPDQLACLENIEGEREVPSHPLVDQTIHDCLTEAMDIVELEKLLDSIKSKRIELIARDLREPSPFAQEIINAKPYAYLDPGEAAERRTNNIQSRGWLDPKEAKNLATLDFAAIEAVKIEAWPQVTNADELHDALVLSGFITEEEGKYGDGLINWHQWFEALRKENRVVELSYKEVRLWCAVERVSQLASVLNLNPLHLPIKLPPKLLTSPTPQEALIEIVRGRLEILGPVTLNDLEKSLPVGKSMIQQALLALENDGFVFQGYYSPGGSEIEWCERRLLARIHRYTIQKLRSEIEPVPASRFMQFMFRWHGFAGEDRPQGPQVLPEILSKLEGFEAGGPAWEGSIIPDRLKDYDHMWLDYLCISGKFTWGRFRRIIRESSTVRSQIKSTPIGLLERKKVGLWIGESTDINLSHNSEIILSILKEKGPSFFDDIVKLSDLLPIQVEEALSELVSVGQVTSDSFSGLRALLVPLKYKSGSKKSKLSFSMDQAGRWTLIDRSEGSESTEFDRLEAICMSLLKRYGVLFRKLADKEQLVPSWRELLKCLRVLEARGVLRGGRFVDGVWGEQFALPEAVKLLRQTGKESSQDEYIAISAADPLNLTGIITPGNRVPNHYNHRILYQNGIPIAIQENKEIRWLEEVAEDLQFELKQRLIRRQIPPKLRQYLGMGLL